MKLLSWDLALVKEVRGFAFLADAEPLHVRSEHPTEMFATLVVPEPPLADGVLGTGRAFFAPAIAAGHDGEGTPQEFSR